MSKTMSPYSALGLLLLFKQKRITLSPQQFDEAVDVVVDVLEQVHNEQYRLEEETPWLADPSGIPEIDEATASPVFDENEPPPTDRTPASAGSAPTSGSRAR